MSNEWLRSDSGGVVRCWWPGNDERYVTYHDLEWGRPVIDDRALFEKLCLEGFQAGLSWLTILRKRENFRSAFADFVPEVVAKFGDDDVERLLADAGIVRHRGKIEAVIINATCVVEMSRANESFHEFIWSFAPRTNFRSEGKSAHPSGLPTTSPSAIALSKELKRRGFSFVGPTTVYSFMQSMGLVNDHLDGCHVHDACESARRDIVSTHDARNH